MTIFVGYPISYETACKLFHQPEGADMDKVIRRTGFDYIYSDKGQYLLGVKVEAASFWDPFVSVEASIIKLLEAKRLVKSLVEKCNLDLSELPLQEMEGDEIPSKNPEPFVFSGAL
jgi:hypothetical protein